MTYDPHCTICSGETMYTEEMEVFICPDCSYDIMVEKEQHDKFLLHELPKFETFIGQVRDGLITVNEFYCQMAELVEPF